MAYFSDLAARIDQYTYDFDPYDYRDSVDSREDGRAQVENLFDQNPEQLAEMLRDMAENAATTEEYEEGMALAEEVENLA